MKKFLKTIEDTIVKETGDAALAALLTLRIEEALTPGFEVRIKNVAKQEVRDLAEKIMAMWSDVVGAPKRERKPSDQLLRLITARANSFSHEDIFDSVYKRAKYISTSTWHNLPENKHHKLDPTIGLRNDESVVKWLYRELDSKRPSDDLKRIDVKIDEKLLT